jgi:hypothetical protein
MTMGATSRIRIQPRKNEEREFEKEEWKKGTRRSSATDPIISKKAE